MEKGNRRSLRLNMLLSGMKGMMSIVFPLITFPYVSKVLGVDNMGKYNFSNSIISYFILLAGLGISTYAIREGAAKRENRKEISVFANEIFTINVYATAISYVLFAILLILVPKFQNYMNLLLILSLQIVFKTIGIEWVYSIYEDYIYIVIRSILFQAIALILLFAVVKSSSDVEMYAVVTVLSTAGSGICNFIHARKYFKLKLTNGIQWRKHMKSIMLLFVMSIAVTIYVNSDITILGFFCNDITVGIYSLSTKVYTVIKTLLSSVLIVSVPRLSAASGNNNMEEFNSTAEEIYKTLITIVLPVVVGIIMLRQEIVLILSNEDYMEATSSIVLLCIALFFCLGAWFWGQCILIPLKEENMVFKITIISALINIGLNFLLVPIWEEKAAAVTTMIAEGISFEWCSRKGHRLTSLSGISSIYIKVLMGCIPVIIISCFVPMLFMSRLMNIIMIFFLSVIVFVQVEIFLKNEIICNVFGVIKGKLKRAEE